MRTTRLLPLCCLPAGLLLALACVAGRAADPAPTTPNARNGLIPRDLLFGNPDRAAAPISPDGKQLRFLAPVDGVLNVWVGPIDKPGTPGLSQKTKRGIRSLLVGPHGRTPSLFQDADGDENWHIYASICKAGGPRI